jgi:hypothetical protein
VKINVDLSTHRGPRHFALITRAHSYSVTLTPADAMELRDELTAWFKTLPTCPETGPNPYGEEHRCSQPQGHRGDHECGCAARWLTPMIL